MAIADVHWRHPHLRFRTLESPYEELTAGLLSGRIDFILARYVRWLRRACHREAVPGPDRADRARRASAGGQKARDAGRSRTGIRGCCRAASPSRQALDACLRHGLPPPQPLVETGDLALVRGLLLQGDMVTALSAHQLRHEIDAGWLRELGSRCPTWRAASASPLAGASLARRRCADRRAAARQQVNGTGRR
jgi:LysR family transcriptional regulator of gallate degradation